MAINPDDFEFIDDGEPLGPLEDIQPQTPTGLPILDPIINLNAPTPGGRALQAVTQPFTIPSRLGRGVGVGAERLLEGIPANPLLPGGGVNTPEDVARIIQNAPAALERGVAAVRPGFEAEEGERVGAFLGEVFGDIPLAIATGGATAPASGAGFLKSLYPALRTGLSAATLSAVHQGSEKGEIDVAPVAMSGTAGAAIPMIRPTLKAIGRGLLAINEGGAAARGIKPFSVDEIRANPRLLDEFKGTAHAVNRKYQRVTGAILRIRNAAKNKYASVGKRFDLPDYFDEEGVTEDAIEAIQSDAFKAQNPGTLAKRYQDLMKSHPHMTPKAKIKSLVMLRRDIKRVTSAPKTGTTLQPISSDEDAILRGMASQINDTLEFGDLAKHGGKELREADRAYSEMRNLYDRFVSKFAKDETRQQSVIRLAANIDPDELVGLGSDTQKLIRDVERATGRTNLLSDLRKELAVKTLREAGPRGVAASFLTGWISPESARNAIVAMDTISRSMGAMGELSALPFVRALLTSTVSQP